MNPYALAWAIIATIGTVLSLLLLAEALRDYRALHDIRNGRRKRVVARMATHALMVTVHGPFAFIGYGALDNPVRPESAFSILILLYGNLVLIAIAVINVIVGRLEPSAATLAESAARDLIATADAAAERVRRVARDAARQLEVVAGTARVVERTAVDQKRSADAGERTADAAEEMADTRREKQAKSKDD